jgi:hypothetical protein
MDCNENIYTSSVFIPQTASLRRRFVARQLSKPDQRTLPDCALWNLFRTSHFGLHLTYSFWHRLRRIATHLVTGPEEYTGSPVLPRCISPVPRLHFAYISPVPRLYLHHSCCRPGRSPRLRLPAKPALPGTSASLCTGMSFHPFTCCRISIKTREPARRLPRFLTYSQVLSFPFAAGRAVGLLAQAGAAGNSLATSAAAAEIGKDHLSGPRHA